MSELAKKPSFTSSGNARLSALRINGESQFLTVVANAITVNHGHIVNAASVLGVHRNTLMKWINHYPSLEEAKETARQLADTG